MRREEEVQCGHVMIEIGMEVKGMREVETGQWLGHWDRRFKVGLGNMTSL